MAVIIFILFYTLLVKNKVWFSLGFGIKFGGSKFLWAILSLLSSVYSLTLRLSVICWTRVEVIFYVLLLNSVTWLLKLKFHVVTL